MTPATQPSSQPATAVASVPAVSFESMRGVNLLRYHNGDMTPARVEGVLAPDAALIVRRDNLKASFMASRRLEFSAIAMVLAGGVSALSSLFLGSAEGLLGGFALAVGATGVGLAGAHRQEDAETLTHHIEASRAVLVPGQVAQSYCRLTSAAQEMEDGGDHDPEAVASVRLAVEGAREIVVLLHGHHAAGTFHTPAASALAGEVYRLAAEVDAYLTLRNVERFAPAEDDALAVLSGTSALTFQPSPPSPASRS